jgi:hypothetical protein
VCRLLPPVLLLSLAACPCAEAPIHASLENAEGLTKGSRVFAAGVAFGEVESVSLNGSEADVAFKLRPGNRLSLRIDACAMVLPEDAGAVLLLFPGKELERLAPEPVPSCELHEQRLTALKQLALSGSGAVSQSIHRFLAALQPAEPAAPPELEACGALSVSRLRIEQVNAMPMVLPSGGKRLWLAVENRSASPVSLETATFLDARGTVALQTRVLEEADLFMSVAIPAHTRREVSAVFAGSKANQVSAVEVTASFVDGAPGDGCSVRWPL